MSHAHPRLPVANLKPGDLIIAKHPVLMVTLLGSCVSATLYHRSSGLGAMCHGLLPESPGTPKDAGGFRYVETAIRHMAGRFRSLGIAPGEIEVKLFGGADVLSMGPGRAGTSLSVGKRNIQSALAVLEVEGLRVLASDLGGTRGRKIFFDTATGEVLLKRLSKAPPQRWNDRGSGRAGREHE